MPIPSFRTRTALRGAGLALVAALTLGAAAACTSGDRTAGGGGSAASTHGSGQPGTGGLAGLGTGAATPGATAAGSDPGAANGTPTAHGARPGKEQLPDMNPTAPIGVPEGGLGHAAAAAAGPTLTGPLPATGAANGKLVAGFPQDVVPVVTGVRVVSSSVASSGKRLQIGLDGASDAAPSAVQAAYVAALVKAGFAAASSPALPGATATAFTHGPDGLVLTVRGRVGGGTELTVAGTLTTD